MININVFPTTLLTRALIKKLISRHKKSGILNVGSYCSESPTSFFTIYSGTKSYIDMFDKCL